MWVGEKLLGSLTICLDHGLPCLTTYLITSILRIIAKVGLRKQNIHNNVDLRIQKVNTLLWSLKPLHYCTSGFKQWYLTLMYGRSKGPTKSWYSSFIVWKFLTDFRSKINPFINIIAMEKMYKYHIFFSNNLINVSNNLTNQFYLRILCKSIKYSNSKPSL